MFERLGNALAHMPTENTVLLLILVAAVVAIAARRLHLPYTVSLVLVGLGLGTLHFLAAPVLDRELLFTLFLPGLIFEAAINMSAQDLWREKGAIITLALPGVILSIALTAIILVVAATALQGLPDNVLHPVGWALALVFGAAIAATDPIAVVALFRSLGVPRRLTLILEGESLFNDGTAIVFFGLVIAYLQHTADTPGSLVTEFLRVVGGGFLIGALVGGALNPLLRRSNDAMVEITLTTIIAYGSFLLADQLGFSGVISTVTAGLICSAAIGRIATSHQASLRDFWEYLGFVLNSMVFLLMGFEIQIPALLQIWPLILVSWLAATLARGALVSLVATLLRWSPRPLPRRWSLILTWGGLRGALSMVLALSLPTDLPGHELVVNLVFGFVLLTIIVQGLSMTPIVRRLGLQEGAHFRALELASSRWRNLAQVLPELKRLRESGLYSEKVTQILETDYQAQLEKAESELETLPLVARERERVECRQLRARLLNVQLVQVRDAFHEGRIDLEIYQRLSSELDLEISNIDADCSELLAQRRGRDGEEREDGPPTRREPTLQE